MKTRLSFPRRAEKALFTVALLLISQQGLAVGMKASGALSIRDAINMGSPGAGAKNQESGATETSLMLSVTLNGQPRDGFFPFIQRHGKLWALPVTLNRLGFSIANSSRDPIPLEGISHTSIRYDESTQQVDITTDLESLRLDVTRLTAYSRETPENIPHSPSPIGLLLNYDAYAATGQNQNTVSGSGEFRLFKNQWIFSTTEVLAPSQRNASSVRRLDTFFRQALLGSETTLTVGDTLSSSAYSTRPTRMAGIQWGKDFSLNPYLVTQPLSLFEGSATLPSDVELYVNGLKQYENKVPVGPFSLNALPTTMGSGQAQLVITDILGRRQELSLPFYNTPSLLAPGLSDWSFEAGKPRLGYGLDSFNYGGPWFASGTWRHGWSDRLTTESHALISRDVSLAYMGGQVRLGEQAGLLSFGVSGSTSSGRQQPGQAGRTGLQWQAGYSWQSNRWLFSANTIQSSPGYRDLPSVLGSPLARRTDQLNASLNMARAGNLSVSYFLLDYDKAPRNRYAGLNWSTSVGSQVYLSAMANQNLGQRRDRIFSLSLSVNLSSKTSVSTFLQRQSDGSLATSVSVDRPLSEELGWGWRAQASRNSHQTLGEADATYRTPWNEFSGGLQITPDGPNAYAQVRGSVVFMEKHLFFSRSNDQSFAVVSTDQRAGIPVYLENRLYGKTNAEGYLLVPNLQPWQTNKINIDTLALPADVTIGNVEQHAVPARYSGTVVRFKLKTVISRVIRLVDPLGQDLPVGTPIDRDGKTQAAVVGYDGQVYLENIQNSQATVVAHLPTGTCVGRVDLTHPAPSIVCKATENTSPHQETLP